MAPQEQTLPGTRPTRRLTTVDTKRIPPDGDPFTAAPHHDDQDPHPHACWRGLVFLTCVVDEDGEEVLVTEAIPCRRCAEEVVSEARS